MKPFYPPRSNDDLCLLFCINPSSLTYSLYLGVNDDGVYGLLQQHSIAMLEAADFVHHADQDGFRPPLSTLLLLLALPGLYIALLHSDKINKLNYRPVFNLVAYGTIPAIQVPVRLNPHHH